MGRTDGRTSKREINAKEAKPDARECANGCDFSFCNGVAIHTNSRSAVFLFFFFRVGRPEKRALDLSAL